MPLQQSLLALKCCELVHRDVAVDEMNSDSSEVKNSPRGKLVEGTHKFVTTLADRCACPNTARASWLGLEGIVAVEC